MYHLHYLKIVCATPELAFVSLLPPKLQRRGLVFERKLVTMEPE